MMKHGAAVVLLAGSMALLAGTPAFAEAVSSGTITAGATRSGGVSVQSSSSEQGGGTVETGWKQSGGSWIYYSSDGTPQHGGFTPDGYLVDENGSWSKRAGTILDETLQYPDRFVPSSQMKGWISMQADLERVARRIQTALSTNRSIQMNDESILYFRSTAQSNGDQLLGLYRDEQTDGYQLRLSVNLGNRRGGISQASTYDYGMFYLMLAKISHTPEVLADAIYGSWQGNNPYHLLEKKEIQVGDVYLSFRVENGAGVYLIRTAWK